jgi:outer membrane receptor protein involved in Fe transport
LLINYIGYSPQTVPVDNKKEINISLQAANAELNEVVLVGTRTAGRVKLETTAPVDLVNGCESCCFLPDSYVYNGKLVSDLYLSYRFSDAVHFALGADNLFNVHPGLGFVEGAAGWAYNNEPGGL